MQDSLLLGTLYPSIPGESGYARIQGILSQEGWSKLGTLSLMGVKLERLVGCRLSLLALLRRLGMITFRIPHGYTSGKTSPTVPVDA